MKILVGVDLSESAQKIMEKAEQIATALSAQLWLVHVTEPEPDFVGFDVGPQSVRDSLSKTFHEEHRQLQEIATQFRNQGLDTTALLVQGATVETILKEASRLDTDMIIVGSHGHGAMYQLLVGSVSEGILQNSKCPVLIVPTHDRGNN